MTEKAAEKVLVVPTAVFHAAGLFHGFSPRRALLAAPARSATFAFSAGSKAELDPSDKQIIPYVVLKWRDQVFHYTRGKGGGEARLHALRLIGIGGHISEDDQIHADPYRAGLQRNRGRSSSGNELSRALYWFDQR